MFCTKCGAQLSQNEGFCKKCGAKVEPKPGPDVAGGTATNRANSLLKNISLHNPMVVGRACAWGCVLISATSFVCGVLIMFLTGVGSFESSEVSLNDVKRELTNKNRSTRFAAEIDDLRGQFAHLDDERWTQARELLNGWVDNWSNDAREKSRLVTEIKTIVGNFPQEQRSAAVDTFYRLKQEKRREAVLHQQSSWLLQFGTLPAITVSVMIFGIFSVLLALIRIEKNTRGIETKKQHS